MLTTIRLLIILNIYYHDSNINFVDTLSFYDLDVIPLPTITADEFEIAINRLCFLYFYKRICKAR